MGTSSSKLIRISIVNDSGKEISGFTEGNSFTLDYTLQENSSVRDLLALINKYRLHPIPKLYDRDGIVPSLRKVENSNIFFI
jgi:hypothetical protein